MRKILDRLLEILACLIFVVMILVCLYQILSRYVLKNPSAFSEEFLRFAIIWVSMLGIAYAFGKGNHLAITFMKDKLNIKEGAIVEIVFHIIFIVFAFFIMIQGGANAVNIALYQISPALGIPMGFVYLSLPVSGVVIILYSILNIKDMYLKYKGGRIK